MFIIDAVLLVPLFTIICTVFLALIIGWAGIITCVLFLGTSLFILWLGRKIVQYKMVAQQAADKRMQMMTNLIEGIRVVKMQTWENSFNDRIALYR